jgi:beta-phosphoglucomutase
VPTSFPPGHAFIFDLDGVLVHSMPLHVEAWRQYLETAGIPVDDLEGAMHGKRNSELVRQWFGDHLTEDLVLGHGAAKERLWRELILKEGIDQYRVLGINEFLERYHDLPMAVGSNAELENIDFVLDRFNLRQYFRVVVNGYQVTHAKPAPDIYLKAAERLEVEPARCIVFEDSPVGIAAARAAGMRVVGIETTLDELEDVDLRVKDFQDPALDAWLQHEVAL